MVSFAANPVDSEGTATTRVCGFSVNNYEMYPVNSDVQNKKVLPICDVIRQCASGVAASSGRVTARRMQISGRARQANEPRPRVRLRCSSSISCGTV